MHWFASAGFVTLIIVLALIEAAVITVNHTRTSRPFRISVWLNSFAGVFLLLALRAALLDTELPWIPLFLTGALIAHLADLAWRYRVLADIILFDNG